MHKRSVFFLFALTIFLNLNGQQYLSLPEGFGLSALYPGDLGIENDSACVFSDNFENSLTLEKWDQEWANAGTGKILQSAEKAHSGMNSYHAEMIRPNNIPSSIGIRKFLEPGYDCLFFRYYAKYAPDADLYHGATHNAGSICARLPGELHESYAGVYPNGSNLYTVVLDTWRPDTKTKSPGNVAFYCYHIDQGHQWGDHFFPSGNVLPGGRSLFGEQFIPRPDFIPELNRWYCYEIMVQANTPGKRDGRIAFWIDGKLMGDFPNLRFREIENLKPNRVGFGLYTDNQNISSNVTMWFDDVVVATEYIGSRNIK